MITYNDIAAIKEALLDEAKNDNTIEVATYPVKDSDEFILLQSGINKKAEFGKVFNLEILDTLPSELAKLNEKIETKVNKVDGKQLSTNDFSNELKTKLDSLFNYDDTDILKSLNSKQSVTDDTLLTISKTIVGGINEIYNKFTNIYTKIEISNLLTEQLTLSKRYTDEEILKLRGTGELPVGMETIVSIGKSLTNNIIKTNTKLDEAQANIIYFRKDESKPFTEEDKSKLDGIATNAQINVQSDYTEVDNTKDSFIKNKPDLSVYDTSISVDTKLNTALALKVDKEINKQLSTEDFTTSLKEKVEALKNIEFYNEEIIEEAI